MASRRRIALILLMSVIFSLTAVALLHQRTPESPPAINLGVDKCNFCQMIIIDKKFSAEYYSSKLKKWLKFDDILCMLEMMSMLDEFNVENAYVHDYKTAELIPAKSAWYVVAKPSKLPTPMSSGIVAFANSTEANILAREVNGVVLTWNELVEKFKNKEIIIET